MDMSANNSTPKADFFDYQNPEWYRQFLLHMRYSVDLRAYEHFAGIVAKFLNSQLKFPQLRPEGDDSLADDVKSMRENGFCSLGKIVSDEELAEIRAHVDAGKAHDGWAPDKGDFLIADAPETVHVAHVNDDVVETTPHLARFASDPRVLARAQAFLGVAPTMMYHAVWWSLAGREAPQDAQLFHIDRHCYRFCKLFVFLTDVDMDNGPHVYAKGSGFNHVVWQRYEALKKLNPEKADGYMAMMRAQRKQDADVEDFFGAENIAYITGKAGEAFLVNTAGIHKGLLPKTHNRLVFQSLYTMLPTIKDKVAPIDNQRFWTEHAAAYGDAVPDDYLAYVNRLMFHHT
jgi:hypothetical protein